LTSKDSPSKVHIPVLLGPTATGKTGFALRLALDLGMEILSCDSRQIYRTMDIGTAKPTADERSSVRHWMIDVASPNEAYSCYQYAEESLRIIRERNAAGVPVLICGGTGLYYKALSEGMGPAIPANPEYRELLMHKVDTGGTIGIFDELMQVDPITAGSSHPSNVQRNIRALEVFHLTGIPLSKLKKQAQPPQDMEFLVTIGSLPRSVLYDRINSRVDSMACSGLWNEFCSLRKAGLTYVSPGLQCVGYKELFDVENATVTMQQALETIKQNSRHYAKRQMTWFRHQVSGSIIDLVEENYLVIRDAFAAFINR
jgi:tRNA dimethylallyltransferase